MFTQLPVLLPSKRIELSTCAWEVRAWVRERVGLGSHLQWSGRKRRIFFYYHCELQVLWRQAVGFWPLAKSEQLERGGLEIRGRSWIRPKAPWNNNWWYVLSGFVVLGSVMILCWVSYQNCGSAIACSKPCWQAGITRALHLCRWEQIQWVWPKTLVEFKLVVSYYSLTSWLNIGTYIHAYRAFIHVVCKSKEYDCNAFVSIYWCPLVLDWKPTVRFQSGQPFHPLGGCGVEWAGVLCWCLSSYFHLGSPAFSWAAEMGFFTSYWIVKANKSIFHLLLCTMVGFWSKYWKQIFSSSWTMPDLFLV